MMTITEIKEKFTSNPEKKENKQLSQIDVNNYAKIRNIFVQNQFNDEKIALLLEKDVEDVRVLLKELYNHKIG